jgi:actin-related protein
MICSKCLSSFFIIFTSSRLEAGRFDIYICLWESIVNELIMCARVKCRHLLVTPKERRVVIVESIFSKTEWRQTLAKVLYLHYEVLSVLWIPNSVSSLCATGQDTALVVEFGSEEAQVIPVYRGVTVLNAVGAHELGARSFDKYGS